MRSVLCADLVDSVVDLLESDRPALKVTSLLCRQWLPRSRHYLFSSIRLRSGRNEYDQAELDRLEAFLTLVSSPRATFIPAVAEVSLLHTREHPVISARAILVMLETFGIRPTRLFLGSGRPFSLAHWNPPAFTSSLVHLELESCYDPPDSICAFPLLETLKVGGKAFAPMVPTFTFLPPRLHTIQTSDPLVLDWILGLDDQLQRQITNLGLLHFAFWSRQWFCVPSQYVESLTFDECRVYRNDDSDDCGPGLRNMRRLKHLKIRSTLTEIPKMLRRILPQLQLSPARRTLESITLTFFGVESYDARPWISADEMLADVATYPCLRSIVISTEDAFLDYGTVAWDYKRMLFVLALHEHLRQCSDRGLLRVDLPIVQPMGS